MRPTPDQIKEAVRLYGGKRQAARWLQGQGFMTSEAAIRRHLDKNPIFPFEVEIESDLLDEVDIDGLIERRISSYERKVRVENAHRVVPVRVCIDGPIGIGFMGDTHIDDDGCDLKTLFQHVDLFDGRNEGLYVGLLGDMWNNWHGRLSHLWKEQSTNAAESRALVRELLTRIQYLFAIFGNHDAWSGHSDILPLLLEGHAKYIKAWRVRLALRFPADRVCKIYAAHDFPGRSMWSEVFGANKRALLDGQHDIYVCGDSHTSAYTHGWHSGSERMYHAVQVGSYKRFDRYVEELNLEDNNLYTCPVALIDPEATSQLNFIRWEFDPFEAALRLAWMRKRWAEAKSR